VKIDPEKNLIYVVDTELGLKVIDIKKLGQPVLVAKYSDESTRYNNVFITEDRIYLNTNLGLTILDLKMSEISSSTILLTENGSNGEATKFSEVQIIIIGLVILSLNKKLGLNILRR
jgi:hypothetical protein